MLTNASNVKGLVIRAKDGEIGTVDQLYFDDETWAIRYLTAETGSWLDDRKVLRRQVEHSPNIDTHRPVSRQHEAEYLGYYGYQYYWKRGASPVPLGRSDGAFEGASASDPLSFFGAGVDPRAAAGTPRDRRECRVPDRN